ncbi:hypothetical protein [Saccharothrix sp. HUAS TT1]|uniref:hypothetical protein n=1 Tax=unclassified Saccharothrix TaxID=2593673 RepID=UPI00345B77E3
MTENTAPHPTVERAALAAADRLAPGHGPRLRADVLAALHAPDRAPDRYLDPIALASLIVSAATLAWTVFQDLRAKTPDPKPEVVARRVRLELTADDVSPQQRDEVIEIVVEEITDDD